MPVTDVLSAANVSVPGSFTIVPSSWYLADNEDATPAVYP